MGSSQIDIGILTDDVAYSVSPAYTTYKIHNINSNYLREYLIAINSLISNKYMITSARQGKSVNKEELLNHELFIHNISEQKALMDKFNIFYKKLKIEKEMLLLLQKQKAFLLQNLFI